jgi:hypothetical protein
MSTTMTDNVDKSEVSGSERVTLNSVGLPLRADAETCRNYMKRGGYCKFKEKCRHNHPEAGCAHRLKFERSAEAGASTLVIDKESASGVLPSLRLNNLGYPRREGDVCRDYLRFKGVCKRKLACPFDHPDLPEFEIGTNQGILKEIESSLNSVGLPLRSGQGIETCQYYIKTKGHCMKKSLCPYNHPEDIALIRLARVENARTTTSGSSDESVDADPHADLKSSSASASVKATKRAATDGNVIKNLSESASQVLLGKPNPVASFNSLGFPIRHGVEDCQNYISSHGKCKFGPKCHYSHPEWVVEMIRKRNVQTVSAEDQDLSKKELRGNVVQRLAALGLPATACAHLYLRGSCEFPSTCKYLHNLMPNILTRGASGIAARQSVVNPGELSEVKSAPANRDVDSITPSMMSVSHQVLSASPSSEALTNTMMAPLATTETNLASLPDLSDGLQEELPYDKPPIFRELLQFFRDHHIVLNDDRMLMIVGAINRAGGRQTLADTNLSELAKSLNAFGMPLHEIRAVCKGMFELKRDVLMNTRMVGN